jgi:hypothetical protein
LQESLAVATRTAALKPSDLARVVVDTTVQPKAVMFPVIGKRTVAKSARDTVLLPFIGVPLCVGKACIDTAP